MKKFTCVFILLGLICSHPASAGNKNKNNSAKAAKSGGGGGFHAGGGNHVNNFSQRSFHGNSMHGSNSSHGNNAFHNQSAHSYNASHGLHAQHGLNAQHNFNANNHGLHGQNFHGQHGLNTAHGNFNGKGFSNHSHAGYAVHRGNFNGHWRSAGHFRSYHDVYRGYHRSFHDHYWWHSHYDRIVVVGGGPYYWNAGYWYPAWGYDPGYTDYAYDGPIYSYDNLPPDQVVVNVQEALQDQGYYTGDVDGQLGPKTRDAITAYQQDHDLDVTSAVDEPTVQSLGLG